MTKGKKQGQPRVSRQVTGCTVAWGLGATAPKPVPGLPARVRWLPADLLSGIGAAARPNGAGELPRFCAGLLDALARGHSLTTQAPRILHTGAQAPRPQPSCTSGSASDIGHEGPGQWRAAPGG